MRFYILHLLINLVGNFIGNTPYVSFRIIREILNLLNSPRSMHLLIVLDVILLARNQNSPIYRVFYSKVTCWQQFPVYQSVIDWIRICNNYFLVFHVKLYRTFVIFFVPLAILESELFLRVIDFILQDTFCKLQKKKMSACGYKSS